MLSARTVRYALERLEDIGIVDEDIYFADARQSLYRLEAGRGRWERRRGPPGTLAVRNNGENGGIIFW